MAAKLPETKVHIAFRTLKYGTKMAAILPLAFQHSNMATALQGTAFVTLRIVIMEHVLSAQQNIYLESWDNNINKLKNGIFVKRHSY